MSTKLQYKLGPISGKFEISEPSTIVFKAQKTVWSRVLTPRKLELVRLIRQKQPRNLSELATFAGRKIGNVHRDLKVLEHFNIVKLEKRGRETVPLAKAEEIVISFK